MEIKRSDNLCNFYILPLLNLNRRSFGKSSNFINSYISKDDKYVVVEVKEAKTDFEEHSLYVTDFVTDFKVVVVFTVPQEFADTISKFKAGKYSQFSQQVKQTIIDKSGLLWKMKTPTGKFISARELLALDRAEELREILEEEIQVKISEDAELVSIPDENNFYDLSLSTITHA